MICEDENCLAAIKATSVIIVVRFLLIAFVIKNKVEVLLGHVEVTSVRWLYTNFTTFMSFYSSF